MLRIVKPDDLLVVTLSIETMELLHAQGPQNNIKAVCDYLRSDRHFEGENDNFDPVPNI
jgi:hypothetical protein